MNTALSFTATATSTTSCSLNGWLKWSLVGAAIWNIFGGVSALGDPALHFSQMYAGFLSLDEPVQLYFYRCGWINVIA